MVDELQEPASPVTQLVIAAGGAGTRLADNGIKNPKPLIEICGETVLGRIINAASDQGITNILVLLHHASQEIIDHVESKKPDGVDISFSIESHPLGNGGALKHASEKLENQFFYIYGDLIFDVDLQRMARFHSASRADLTLFTHPTDHPFDADLLEIESSGRLLQIKPYPHTERPIKNIINSAIYLVTQPVISCIPQGKSDFARDVISRTIKSGLTVMAYKSREYVRDMGTPARIQLVEQHFKEGLVERLKIQNPVAAYFFRLEDVLEGFPTKTNNISIRQTAQTAIKFANNAGVMAILLLNQEAGDIYNTIHSDTLTASIDDNLAQGGVYFDEKLFYNAQNFSDKVRFLNDLYNIDWKKSAIVKFEKEELMVEETFTIGSVHIDDIGSITIT